MDETSLRDLQAAMQAELEVAKKRTKVLEQGLAGVAALLPDAPQAAPTPAPDLVLPPTEGKPRPADAVYTILREKPGVAWDVPALYVELKHRDLVDESLSGRNAYAVALRRLSERNEHVHRADRGRYVYFENLSDIPSTEGMFSVEKGGSHEDVVDSALTHK